jgi:hypothetical protein
MEQAEQDSPLARTTTDASGGLGMAHWVPATPDARHVAHLRNRLHNYNVALKSCISRAKPGPRRFMRTTRIACGELADEIDRLKREQGGVILAHGARRASTR